MKARLRRHWRSIALFLAGVFVFSLVAWNRIGQRSRDAHFVYQAQAWLDGKLTIPRIPGADDPAVVDVIELKDGTQVRGRPLVSERKFRTFDGREITRSEVKNPRPGPGCPRSSWGHCIRYNSFPPFPSALLLPQVAISGTQANDVLFTVLIAALILPLMFSLLRRLANAGLTTLSPRQDMWLTLGLSFGSVLFFASVQGRVWFTAHVIGVALCILYVHCAVEAKRAVLAGICLGFATMTRTPMAFLFPLFFFEAWRVSRGNRAAFIKRVAAFSAPIVVIATFAMIHNYIRFESLTEFGHSYLRVRQQVNIEKYGLFDLHYLPRNFAIAFGLIPEFISQSPWIKVSGHGLAIWFTTPALLFLLWPRFQPGLPRRDDEAPDTRKEHAARYFYRAVLITTLCVAVPGLFYQNTGWLQFGYRFSLDYMVLLFVLLAVGMRHMRRIFVACIIVGIVINLFGAITFDRYPKYYDRDFRSIVKN